MDRNSTRRSPDARRAIGYFSRMPTAEELTRQQKALWSAAAPGWERSSEWFDTNSAKLAEWLCDAAGLRAELSADEVARLKTRVFEALKPHMKGSTVELAAVPILCVSGALADRVSTPTPAEPARGRSSLTGLWPG